MVADVKNTSGSNTDEEVYSFIRNAVKLAEKMEKLQKFVPKRPSPLLTANIADFLKSRLPSVYAQHQSYSNHKSFDEFSKTSDK